jgi:hypothetical protein
MQRVSTGWIHLKKNARDGVNLFRLSVTSLLTFNSTGLFKRLVTTGSGRNGRHDIVGQHTKATISNLMGLHCSKAFTEEKTGMTSKSELTRSR